MAFGDNVAQRGWQTGSVLPADLLPGLAPHLSRPGKAAAAIGDDDWLVVVSQTCDIVANKFEAEPFVEVLHAHRREGKPRKEYVDLRSTRQIDFRPNPGTHKGLVLTAHAIGDRYIVPREWFTHHDPDPARRLSVDAARRLLAWYALRAARHSWPDELERRLRGAKPALLDAPTLLAHDIAEVRVAFEERDEELPADQTCQTNRTLAKADIDRQRADDLPLGGAPLLTSNRPAVVDNANAGRAFWAKPRVFADRSSIRGPEGRLPVIDRSRQASSGSTKRQRSLGREHVVLENDSVDRIYLNVYQDDKGKAKPYQVRQVLASIGQLQGKTLGASTTAPIASLGPPKTQNMSGCAPSAALCRLASPRCPPVWWDTAACHALPLQAWA